MKIPAHLNTGILLATIEESPVPTALYKGKDLRIEIANEAMLLLLGKKRAVIGSILKNTLTSAKELAFLSGVRKAFSSKTIWEMDFQNPDNQQTTNNYRFTFKPLKDENGKIWAVIHTASEIQQVSRKDYRPLPEPVFSLMQQAGTGFWSYDHSSQQVTWQAAEVATFSRTSENQLNITFDEFLGLIHRDDRLSVDYQIKKALGGGREGPLDISFRMIASKDGKVRWMRMLIQMDQEAAAVRLIGVSLSISGEKAALEEHQKLFYLLENSSDYVGIGAAGGKALFLNKAGRKLIGIGADEDITRLELRDFYSAGEFGRMSEEVIPALTKSGKWSGLLRLRHFKTKEEIPCLAEMITIHDPATGMMTGRGAFLRDLRPDLATKRSLIAGERRFRNMINQAPVAIIVLKGEDLRVEAANNAALNLWHKNEIVIGRPLLDVLPELEKQIFPDLLRKVYETGQPLYGSETLSYLLRDGKLEKGYIDFAYTPFKEEDGTVSGVIMRGIDVTDQVQEKIVLERNEKRLRNALLDSPVPTALLLGSDLIIELANDAMLRLWGKNKTVFGQHFVKVVPDSYGAFVDMLNVMETGLAMEIERNQLDYTTFENVRLHLHYQPLRDPDGKIYGLLLTAVDHSVPLELHRLKK